MAAQVYSVSQDAIWHGCAQTTAGYVAGVTQVCHSSSAGDGPCLKRIITVFDENPHAQAHFDYGAAWAQHGGSVLEFVLNIDSIAYRTDHEATAMVQRILEKAGASKPAPPLLSPLNPPGRWDFFVCGRTLSGDHVEALCRLLEAAEKTVWWLDDMEDSSDEAVAEAIKAVKAAFLRFFISFPSCVAGGVSFCSSDCWPSCSSGVQAGSCWWR